MHVFTVLLAVASIHSSPILLSVQSYCIIVKIPMNHLLSFLSDSFQGAAAVVTLQLHFACIVCRLKNSWEESELLGCVKQTQEMMHIKTLPLAHLVPNKIFSMSVFKFWYCCLHLGAFFCSSRKWNSKPPKFGPAVIWYNFLTIIWCNSFFLWLGWNIRKLVA